MTLFEKYSQLLKRRFSEDFQEIVSTDDYMPMPINSAEEYEKVVTVSWYESDKTAEQLNFPCVLPFSQMYPLCCIDIRNFLNQIYLFSDDHFQRSSIIDETLRTSLDELLSEKVCQSLIDRLSSQYPGQIVQILTNLEHFEVACQKLQDLLFEARSGGGSAAPIVLSATMKFRAGKKTAEKRIFELVNSKIDDLIEIAEYDWYDTTQPFYDRKCSDGRQDDYKHRKRAQQLHAGTHPLPLEYHEFRPSRPPHRDQGTHILRRPQPRGKHDPRKSRRTAALQPLLCFPLFLTSFLL